MNVVNTVCIVLIALASACANTKTQAKTPETPTLAAQARAELEADVAKEKESDTADNTTEKPTQGPPPEKPAVASPISTAAMQPFGMQFAPPAPGGIASYVAAPGQGRLLIIGFTDVDPCRSNAYELAISGGMVTPQTMRPRMIQGRCAGIGSRHDFHLSIRVNDREMDAVYIGGRLASACVNRKEGPQFIPLVPPRTRVWWLMPTGGHVIHVDLYQDGATGDCYDYVGTVTYRARFPYRNSDWGFAIEDVDNRLDRRADPLLAVN